MVWAYRGLKSLENAQGFQQEYGQDSADMAGAVAISAIMIGMGALASLVALIALVLLDKLVVVAYPVYPITAVSTRNLRSKNREFFTSPPLSLNLSCLLRISEVQEKKGCRAHSFADHTLTLLRTLTGRRTREAVCRECTKRPGRRVSRASVLSASSSCYLVLEPSVFASSSSTNMRRQEQSTYPKQEA